MPNSFKLPVDPINLPKTWQWVVTLALVFFVMIASSQKINFVTADLGRHLKNGEIFLQDFKAISSNFYSYTQPNFYTTNHHWGSGILFYLIRQMAGFSGLSLFYILLNSLAFLLFFRVAWKKTDFNIALLFGVLAIPLIASRREVRPEVISYFFFGVYYYLLSYFSNRKFILNLIFFFIAQVLWVNSHILFILGPLLIGAFAFNSLVFEKNKKKFLHFGYILFTTLAVSFLNPFGLKGVIAPFIIFQNYGYMVAENQTVLFMQNRFGNPVYLHFEILLVGILLSFGYVIAKSNIKKYGLRLILILSFGFLGYKMIRNFPLFGLVFIPIAAENVYLLFKQMTFEKQRIFHYALVICTLILVFVGLFIPNTYLSFIKPASGIGLIEGEQASADFFKKNNLQGPIFNNYDIGGYLIYNLYPKEKVFVDNRPEAYSNDFFQKTYIPMQSDENVWAEKSQANNFNVIYFYRRDYTPWAQPFLIKRIQDPTWAPVFVDDYVIILLKRNQQNQELIKRFELPKEMFNIQ